MLPADYEGERMGFVRGQEIMWQKLQWLKDNPGGLEEFEEELEEITDCCASSAGACGELTTGNSMAVLTEALGFSMPRTSTSMGVSAEKIWQSKQTGEKIVELAHKNIKPSDIFTAEALHNAIAVEMAVCGGTNSVVHLQSFAHEAGIPYSLDTWDAISRKVPALCSVAPTGKYVLYDFHKAGGVPVVMKRIKEFLNLGCITVTGETVGRNLEDAKPQDSDVIRSLDNPVWPQGAVAVLRGNLAPRGAVTRHTVVQNKELLKKTYTARVFDSLDEAIVGIFAGKITPGDAIVCRYEGPRGGPAMTECLSLVRALKAKAVKDVAVITDGRFSGWTKGYVAIGHVCPEAQVGGTLALLHDGDRISLDVPARKLDVELSEAELSKRKSQWRAPAQPHATGVLAVYARLALQADQGAGWPVRPTD